jgi:hypothetical protein
MNYSEEVIAKANKASSKKKGCAKAGRNKVKCLYYRQSKYRKNKLSGLVRHLLVHTTDATAIAAKERLMAA